MKMGKMLLTAEMCDEYQRFIVPFTLLVYMFEDDHNRT